MRKKRRYESRLERILKRDSRNSAAWLARHGYKGREPRMPFHKKYKPQRATAFPKYVHDCVAVLVASNEFHSGQATWRRKQGIWFCQKYDPCLAFLKSLDPAGAKLELARRGYSWHWRHRQPHLSSTANADGGRACDTLVPENGLVDGALEITAHDTLTSRCPSRGSEQKLDVAIG